MIDTQYHGEYAKCTLAQSVVEVPGFFRSSKTAVHGSIYREEERERTARIPTTAF